MNVRTLLEAQNPWWREPRLRVASQHPVRRDLQPTVLRHLSETEDRRALLLLGPRQVGKTTLLEQVVDDLLQAKWPAANLTYFDFSDDRLIEEVTAREVVEIEPVGLDRSRPRIFLLDEISRAPRWDRWLKQAVDDGVGRIVATDSAASLLRAGGRESGQGRWDEMHIEGLSFGEFLRIDQGITDPDARRHPSPTPPVTFERYLAIGGFPEHVFATNLSEMRRRLRADIVDRAILRDLARRVENPERVRDLFVYLVQESGAELVTRHRADDLEADPRTVESWIEMLGETLLVRRLERRREKATKRLRSRPKIYATDHGLVTAFAASADPVNDPSVRSKVFEAVVYRHLRDLDAPLTYLRMGNDLEVDFVVETPSGPLPVEVTASRVVKTRKLERLQEVARRIGANRSVVIHGGVTEGPGESGDAAPASMPLFRFLAHPEGLLRRGDD